MPTNKLIVPILAVAALAMGCRNDDARTAVLKEGAGAVCDTARTMTLRTVPEGRFGLIAAVVDNAHLGALLHNVLPPTPGPRVLMLDFAPQRSREFRWVIPLVEAEGYDAYKADAHCAFRPDAPVASASVFPSLHD